MIWLKIRGNDDLSITISIFHSKKTPKTLKMMVLMRPLLRFAQNKQVFLLTDFRLFLIMIILQSIIGNNCVPNSWTRGQLTRLTNVPDTSTSLSSLSGFFFFLRCDNAVRKSFRHKTAGGTRPEKLQLSFSNCIFFHVKPHKTAGVPRVSWRQHARSHRLIMTAALWHQNLPAHKS